MAVEQSRRKNNPPGRSAAFGMISCPVMDGVRRVIMTITEVMLAMRKMNQFRLGNGLSLRGGRTDSAFVKEADDISMFMVEME